MRIAITGATGFIAQQLVVSLRAAGHQLELFGRDTSKLSALFAGESCHDYSQFEANVRGCDAVIHTAVINNNVLASLEAFRKINVALSLDLASQAERAGVPLFINFTTLQAVQPAFRSFYAQSKHEAEQALSTLKGIHVLQLRLPAVYADSFRGKLAVLNRLPFFARVSVFKLLAALRPTLDIVKLERTLNQLLAQSIKTLPTELLITDGQNNNAAYAVLQRLMDLGFAVCVILFLWWALIGAWLAIGLSSQGPVIFKQTRVGRSGKPFTCYKFRTMAVGVKQAATHEVGKDAITRVGHFLRRTKIDELPQIINIFRNEMSLIGPRPCLESQTALIEARRQRGVLDVKPGISGLAQIQGVDMSDPEKLAKLDAEYVARQSILLDLKIFLATARGKALQDRTKT